VGGGVGEQSWFVPPLSGRWSGRPHAECRFLIHKQTKFNEFPLEYIEKLMEYWLQNKRAELLPRKINIQITMEEPE